MHMIDTVNLYNGKVKIDFHFDTENPKIHYYTMHGKKDRLLSVTAVTSMLDKPALIPWAVNLAIEHIDDLIRLGIQITPEHLNEAKNKHRVKSAQAASIGTQVHEWCERYIKNTQQDLPEDPNVLNGVMGFLQWVKEHSVTFGNSEKIVYSKKYKYVGTLDAEAYIDGKLHLIDFKTSSGIYNEMRYQVAAYRNAAQEEGAVYEGDNILARFDKQTGNF